MEDEDRFSKLPDDMLLCILEKANTVTAIRTSFLSTRWRHLPACLPHVNLDISDFMPSDNTSANQIVIDEAMSAMVKAARICLAGPGSENAMKTVNLHLHLTASYVHDIGELVCKAIDNNKVTSVELALLTEKLTMDSNEVNMFQHRKNLVCFFDTVPSLFRCLTKLFLHNTRFDEPEMHRSLNSCQQLQHLEMHNCDTGVMKIDMPNSNISYLKLDICYSEKVEFVCLPKLAEFHCESWSSLNAPFSLGYVPCLENVNLVCAALFYQSGLYISDLLHGSTAVHALTLDFQGEKIWMLPEGNKLCTSFNKLTKMSIHGIHVKFGLSWTIGLLKTAPSLKAFRIEVWNHVCDVDNEEWRIIFSERTNSWEKNDKFNGFRHLRLTKFEFGGFMTVKKHMQFIKSVVGYAPNLEKILLEDKDRCESCDALNSIPQLSSTGSMFPKSECRQRIIRNKLGVGDSCSLQVIFK